MAAHGFLNVFYILMWRQSRLAINLFGKMADFVLSEAEVEDNICDDMSVVSEERESDRELIDDAEYDESVENYCAFDNVSRDYNDAINDSLSGFDFSQEATNYYSDNEIKEEVVDNFKDSKKKADKFWKTLVNPHGDENSDFFFFFFCSILYAIRFQLTEKINTCENEDELKNDISKVDLSESFLIKDSLKQEFDILNFEQQCH